MIKIRYLFRNWKNIEKKIRDAEKVLIISDYDGTLVPIVDRPNLVALPKKMKDILQMITNNQKYNLAIVSGRYVYDVKMLVNIDKIFYAGNHGFEVIGPNLHWMHPELKKSGLLINSIQKHLEKELGGIKGIIIENKIITLSVHFRLCKKKHIPLIRKIVRNAVRKYEKFRITTGKKIFEIRPNIKWDKGKASLWIMNFLDKNILSIYIGDDKTDEDAFKAIKNGITILVSKRKISSKAKYFIRNISEVQRLFNEILRIA